MIVVIIMVVVALVVHLHGAGAGCSCAVWLGVAMGRVVRIEGGVLGGVGVVGFVRILALALVLAWMCGVVRRRRSCRSREGRNQIRSRSGAAGGCRCCWSSSSSAGGAATTAVAAFNHHVVETSTASSDGKVSF